MRIGRVAIGALIAFAVSVACLLPPGIHFVTGPVGPAVGGYVAGAQLRLTGAESALVGLLMSLSVGATTLAAFEFGSFMPNLALQAAVPLSLIAAIYVGVLGAGGCWFASRNAS